MKRTHSRSTPHPRVYIPGQQAQEHPGNYRMSLTLNLDLDLDHASIPTGTVTHKGQGTHKGT